MLYNNAEIFINKYMAFKKKYEANETFERTDLCDIMDRNLSDKSYPFDLKENEEEHIRKRAKCPITKPNHVVGFHNYTLFYEAFFSHVRNKEINIFETFYFYF